MRVLYFTEKDSPHDQRFLRALADTNHQVYVLRQFPCHPTTPEGINDLSWPDNQPVWSNWHGWQIGIRYLADILEDIQPDLVHAGPVQGPALITALSGFHPLVTMSWGSDILLKARRSPWMQFATRVTLENTDIFLGDCQAVVNEAVQLGVPLEKVVRFPWGVDLNHFSPANGKLKGKALRKSLGWESNFVVLCNRSWAPIYGVDLLAEAFKGAVKENDQLRLLLIGDGPQADHIKQILAPVADKVNFQGWLVREDMPAAYYAADLFVSPSYCDGSSISLLEALACERPVLVSDIPGNLEWVLPGETGKVFKTGDIESLKTGLLQLVSDPQLTLYGRRSRMLAEDRADWGQNFKKLLTAYQMAVT